MCVHWNCKNFNTDTTLTATHNTKTTNQINKITASHSHFLFHDHGNDRLYFSEDGYPLNLQTANKELKCDLVMGMGMGSGRDFSNHPMAGQESPHVPIGLRHGI